ncbi:MAG: hypothetical protein ABJJ99_12755 [Ascidiaceihabitans sp.]|uniref:hypothetical protein n=2 Tax=Ascidiaceihabitans sp. TaxID=1872644 RepID=UPI0032982245
MIGWLTTSFMRSTWGKYLMIGLAVLAGVKVWGEVKEREGRRTERSRQSVETLKTMRRMQDAGAAVSTDRSSIVSRLRDGRF